MAPIERIPPSIVRAFGRAQFRFPVLGVLIHRAGRRLTAREGVIAHGPAAGLRFDGTGGHPGYLLGTSDPAEQALLERELRPGSIFYDCGAHTGFFAVLGSRLVGSKGRVFAFEPSPEAARRMRANLDLNGFDHAEVVQAAVGAASGRTRLRMSGASAPTNKIDADATDGIDVELVSIDRWRDETKAPGPDVVMLDVEGAELDALSGMLETLAESRPVILCEVHWLGTRFTAYFERHLRPMGYRLTSLSDAISDAPIRWHAVLRPID